MSGGTSGQSGPVTTSLINCETGSSVSTLAPFYPEHLFKATLESELITCISIWFGSCRVPGKKSLERLVRTAERVSGSSHPLMLDVAQSCCFSRHHNIIKDSAHSHHGLLPLSVTLWEEILQPQNQNSQVLLLFYSTSHETVNSQYFHLLLDCSQLLLQLTMQYKLPSVIMH